MSVKQTLRQWLANGENDRVVEALQTIADQFGDKYFRSNVTFIAGRFNGIKRDRQNGVISNEFYNIQINQIRQALQDLIEEVPLITILDKPSFVGNSNNINSPVHSKNNHANAIDTSILLTINRDFSSFSDNDQNTLLQAIGTLLNLNSTEIRILKIEEGSIKVTIQLTAEDAAKLIHLINEKGYLKELNVVEASIIPNSSNNLPSTNQPEQASPLAPINTSTLPHLPWIIGLGLLILATLLAAVIPCPAESLSLASRILLSLGAAGIATILPGLFSIEVQGIKAGSAIGVFALVYLVNPAKAMEDNSRCNKAPFEFTINLQPDPEINISNQYPKLENATLQIWTDNDWKPAAIDVNNLARYFSLPGDFKNQKVAVKLIGRYWSLKADSVQLSGKSQTLTIAPDGKLGKIEGKVRSTDGTIFLPGVAIEIEGVLDTTDTRGSFAIQIPPDKQKTRYLYTAQKKGSAPKTEPFDFDGEPIEIRLKK